MQKTQGESGGSGLKRTIPFPILLLLGINAIIGTGIFFVPGIAAKLAGPASIISWVLVAIIALVIAACFAELVSMFPKCGGVFEYTKQAFGEFAGFIVGWISWIVANVTIAMLVIGSLDYLGVFFQFSMIHKLIISIIFVLGMNYVSFRGINMSVKLLLVFAIFTIMSLWTLLTWGGYYFNVNMLMPVALFPKISIVIAMLYIMETFFGWETVTYLAEETKDPETVIPKVMIWGTLAVTFLAIGVVAVVLGAVHWETLANSSSPLYEAAIVFMGPGGAKIMAILIFLNIIGGAAAWIVVTPRLVFALARENLLPNFLSKIHKKYNTPYTAIMLQSVLTILILLSGSYLFLLEMLLPMAIFMYAMVLASVSILRFTKPELERKFKVPLGKFTPIVVAMIILFLAGGIELGTILSGALFVLMGVPLYFIAGVAYKSKITKRFEDISARFGGKGSVGVSKKVRKNIFSHLENLRGKRVLVFGTDAGILTIELARAAGLVHFAHISTKHLESLKKLANKHRVNNIEYITENAEARHNLHAHIQKIDAVVSVGALGYLDNPYRVLLEISKRVKKGGRLYFVDYDRVLKLMSTKPWLKDNLKTQRVFKRAGLHVNVVRRKGILWDTIHIYGIKT